MFLCLLIQFLPELFVLDLFSMWSAPLFPFPFVHISFVYGCDQELIRRVDGYFTRSEHSQTDKDSDHAHSVVGRILFGLDLCFDRRSFLSLAFYQSDALSFFCGWSPEVYFREQFYLHLPSSLSGSFHNADMEIRLLC